MHRDFWISGLLWLAALCAALLLSPFGHGTIYRYTDAQGITHYSDEAVDGSRPYRPDNPVQVVPATDLPTDFAPTAEPAPGRSEQQRQQAQAKKQKLKRHCEQIEAAIDRINAQLRRGHSNEQGNRWRRQRRDYQQQRYNDCR